jgi:arsenate reductase (glutaredoxin)
MSLTVYGIRACGTVKKARRWLDDRGLTHTYVDFRKTPPSADQVIAWVAAFGAKAMRNTSGGAYRALGDEKKSWDDARWTKAFCADPMLIKRPIITRGNVPLKVGFRGDDASLAGELLGD